MAGYYFKDTAIQTGIGILGMIMIAPMIYLLTAFVIAKKRELKSEEANAISAGSLEK